MPGRAGARSGRSSANEAAPRKPAAITKTRASARSSANTIEIPDEGEATPLRAQICHVFADAQRSTAGQRKLVVNLRKIQEACCYEPTKTKKGKKGGEVDVGEEFGEEDFNEEVS